MRTPDEIISAYERDELTEGELFAFLLEITYPETLPIIKTRLGEETDLWKKFKVIAENDEAEFYVGGRMVKKPTQWGRFCHWVRWG